MAPPEDAKSRRETAVRAPGGIDRRNEKRRAGFLGRFFLESPDLGDATDSANQFAVSYSGRCVRRRLAACRLLRRWGRPTAFGSGIDARRRWSLSLRGERQRPNIDRRISSTVFVD
jgi:hypothetical protein